MPAPEMPDLGLDFEALLRQRGWLRALARGLVREGEVDDLLQESWLAALGAGTGPRRSLRAWFAGLARNAARGLRRRSGAQAEWAGVADDRPAADELLARAELQERLIAAVRALREPYRATVLLHYFEGLTLEEVGARTGVPGSTARTRLSRALAELRERFQREPGGTAWALVVALARGGGAGIQTATEVTVMATAAKVTVGIVLGGAALVAFWRIRGDEPRVASSAGAPAQVPVLRASSQTPESEHELEVPPVAREAAASEPVGLGLPPDESATAAPASPAGPSPLERELDLTAESFLTAQPDAAGMLDLVGRLADEVRLVPDSIRFDNFGRFEGELAVGAGLKGTFSVDGSRYQIQLETTEVGEAFTRRELRVDFSAQKSGETSAASVLVSFNPECTAEAIHILGTGEQYSGWALQVDPLTGTTARPFSMQAIDDAGDPGWRLNSAPPFPPLALPWVQDARPFERWRERLRSFRPQ